MTKKDFISLADTLKQCPEIYYSTYIENMANDLAKRYKNFDKARWLGYIRGECTKNGKKINDRDQRKS